MTNPDYQRYAYEIYRINSSWTLKEITCCCTEIPKQKDGAKTKRPTKQHMLFEFFHNSRLIGWIEQKRIYKKFGDMTRDWTQITCLAVRHFNHYIRMFSVLVWGCNWILFMHRWFCLIRLIGQKSHHFEKKLDCEHFNTNLSKSLESVLVS